MKEKVSGAMSFLPQKSGSAVEGTNVSELRASFFAAYRSLKGSDTASLGVRNVEEERAEQLRCLRETYEQLRTAGYPLGRLLKDSPVDLNRDDIARYLTAASNSGRKA